MLFAYKLSGLSRSFLYKDHIHDYWPLLGQSKQYSWSRQHGTHPSMSKCFFSLLSLTSPVSASTNPPPRSSPSMCRNLHPSPWDWPDAVIGPVPIVKKCHFNANSKFNTKHGHRTYIPSRHFIYVEYIYIWERYCCVKSQMGFKIAFICFLAITVDTLTEILNIIS